MAKTLNTSKWERRVPRGEFGFFPTHDASVETKRRLLGGKFEFPSLITSNSITTVNSSLALNKPGSAPTPRLCPSLAGVPGKALLIVTRPCPTLCQVRDGAER